MQSQWLVTCGRLTCLQIGLQGSCVVALDVAVCTLILGFDELSEEPFNKRGVIRHTSLSLYEGPVFRLETAEC